eukprot:5742286-Amphidinium_carterae.1
MTGCFGTDQRRFVGCAHTPRSYTYQRVAGPLAEACPSPRGGGPKKLPRLSVTRHVSTMEKPICFEESRGASFTVPELGGVQTYVFIFRPRLVSIMQPMQRRYQHPRRE